MTVHAETRPVRRPPRIRWRSHPPVLAPAVLVLLARGAWWVPGWLGRLLPDLDIEGQHALEARTEAATERA